MSMTISAVLPATSENGDGSAGTSMGGSYTLLG